MLDGWRHRIVSLTGACLITISAVTVANHPLVQRFSMVIPIYNRLEPHTLSNGALTLVLLTTLVAILISMIPLYRARPRRALDTIALAERRVFVAMIALAAIGYFDYTYRMPRTTMILSTILLGVLMPMWFVGIRRRPLGESRRAIIVGDDPGVMEAVFETTDLPIIGYVSSPAVNGEILGTTRRRETVADGGIASINSLSELECLGGLSRLDDILLKYDIDTAVLGFSHPDRAEFFGTLDILYDHGVEAKVHRDHADNVLTTDIETGELVDVDLDPWGWIDYVLKRVFDIVFSISTLLVLSPIMAIIALAIKAEDGGPILYHQRRTAAFGETFTIPKFRSMLPNAEGEGPVLSEEDAGGYDPRVTSVGKILRKTHLDEIPQLWSVLIGDMSVVGPRPERPELDYNMESGARSWRRRWFVKPGLTGLAQINDVTGFDPDEKLRYDIAYIRNQSFWFDLKILIRQLWMVARDCLDLIRVRGRH